MYENITYAEIKKLPAVEKPYAWKELKSLYPTQKELAEKFGVSPAVVYNMISRYVGREKRAAKLELIKTPKKTRNRRKKQSDRIEQDAVSIEAKPIVPEIKNIENIPEIDSFSIAIKKTVSGEDAQFFLNGIGSTLLKSQKYVIEVRISEK